MPLPRPVLVDAVLERPPAPPWVGTVPFPERAESWQGWLLGWRWVNRAAGTWTGLVRYQREGLLYEHWIAGELLSSPP